MAVKIIIADDHSMVREGLKQVLELDGDVEVIGEAKDGKKCLELLSKINAQVLLLDIDMPNLSGLEVLEKIKEMNIDIKILNKMLAKIIQAHIKIKLP